MAKMIKEAFLQQNFFSSYDRFCPLWKSFWMMKNILTFFDQANEAVKMSPKITWSIISNSMSELLYDIHCMKLQVC